ncbi:MAG: TonB-dependent receptor [Prolixibacteraceae bacterium]|nr:TonB-dependent receptor [Prolixibacteraceae bacterium]
MKDKLIGIILLFTGIIFNPFQSAAGISGADDDKPGIIKGKVENKNTGESMEFVSIAVFDKLDSTLISGDITDQTGEFEITGMTYGEYYLVANFVGFNRTKVADIVIDEESPLVEVENIDLDPTTVELGGVNVVADKYAIEYKLDRKVVNVSQVVSAAGGTAVEALENTPSVQVDIEGNVSLRGSSNFTVLIDGRPSVLSGSDALRQIPASAIENIEVITNPSAKYEPDGNSGIINLVMKKNSMNGFSGIVNGTIATKDKYRGDFTLNYRTEKFNFTLGADWRDETGYGSMFSKRETYSSDTTSYLDMEGSRNFIRSGHNYKSGIELFLSPKSTLSFVGELGKSNNSRTEDGIMHEYSIPASNELFSVNDELSESVNDFYSGRLSFQHLFNTEGHKLEAMIFYSDEDGSDSEEENEVVADANYNRTDDYLSRISTLETEKETDIRFQFDYTYPFSENGRLEAGMLSRLENETEGRTFKDFDEETNEWIVNDFFSSTTDFKRDIHAVYTTFSNQLGNIQFMAGLRGELTIRDIKNSAQAETSSLNRFDLFPTIHLSYPFNENNELMASYSRRINRPRGWSLDPTPAYWNRYTVRIGNPDLKPEYTDSYELGYMRRFKGASYISLDAFHRITHNLIDRIDSLGSNGIFYSLSQNFDKDLSTGIEFSGNINFTKWLLVNASVSMFHYQIKGNINAGIIDRESTNWSGRMNTTVKFSENSRLQINGFYRGPSVSAQGESKAMIFSTVSYRHEFFDKSLTATLSVQDPFGTAFNENESYGENFKSWSKWEREPRVLRLTLSYRINNFKEERGGNNRENNGGGMDFGGEGEM